MKRIDSRIRCAVTAVVTMVGWTMLTAALFASQSTLVLAATLSEKAATAPVVKFEGKLYSIIDGAAYLNDNGSYKFIKQLYDPDFYAKNYVNQSGKIYRKAPDGKLFPVYSQFADNFEGVSSVKDLINPTRGWTDMTLQSPATPTAGDYVKLRKLILQGKSDYLDNRVEPSTAQVHSGKGALRTYAVAPGWSLPVTKASLDTGLLHFKKGDDVWFSGWYYIKQGHSMSLIDLESSYVSEWPGMRLLLSDTLEPRLELKWGDKPTYKVNHPVNLPVGKWVNIRMHLKLSDQNDGVAQLWIGSDKVIDATGQTLPLPDTVYDNMQTGITASFSKGTVTEVFLDDVAISHTPIP